MRRRAGILVALVLLAPFAARGQQKSEEQTVKIVLYPAAEPKPALKYVLLPPLLERRPGNAAVLWNRVPAEQTRFFSELYSKGGFYEKIDKWQRIPLTDPRAKDFRKEWDAWYPKSIFDDIDRAARFESCDWQLPIRDEEFVTIRIPEIQQARGYARLLAPKIRLEIAEGKYQQAVHNLQSGYALARHVAQGPTLVNALVGVAIADIMSRPVQEFIQQPDAPNLYWALSGLPRPLVDFRHAFEAEMSIVYLSYPELRDLDKKDLSAEEWRRLLETTAEMINRWGPRPVPAGLERAAMTAEILQGYPRAKKALVERGRRAAEVDAMPVPQVVMLYTMQTYDELRDEMFKWFSLPYWEAKKGMRSADETLRSSVWTGREIIPIAGVLMPAMQACKAGEARMEWQIALLRIYEALRLYAASHDGRLPDLLGDVSEVPIPVNPFDGQPFLYQRSGSTAVIDGAGPPGIPHRFQVQLMKKGDSR